MAFRETELHDDGQRQSSRPQRRALSGLSAAAEGAFKDKTDEEIRFIQSIKIEHRHLPAGSDIIHPGQQDAELYTLFSGWAFRYQLLPDGRRQILNFLLPGDLVGLQASLLSAAQHGIEALTEVELCVFPRKRIWDLFVHMPNLAYEVAWLGSREESLIDQNLTSVGQRNASERIAALVISLYRRAEALASSRMAASASRSRNSNSRTRSGSRWSTPARRGHGCARRASSPPARGG